MLKYIIATILVFCSFIIIAQEKELEQEHILNTQNWDSEFFDFPIRFAREIPYTGYEEAVFPTGWSNQESDQFWSYAFAWKIDAAQLITIENLKTNLNRYFDGLLDSQNRQNGSTILVTNTSMVKDDDLNKKQDDRSRYYKGSIYLFEGRYTQKMMTLYTTAEQHYCEKEQKTTIMFRFSPQLFEEAIWKELNAVSLAANSCD